MQLNYLAFAVPFFLILIGLEYGLTKRKGQTFFRFADSVANLNVGIADRLLDIFVAGLAYFFYDYLQKNYGLFTIRPGVATWVFLLIVTDFVWYWYHRLAHEINVFWAIHVVHHQSEEFNYTVSTRITVFQAAARTGFWVVLPLIGFPAPMITAVLLVHGLYPFFLHTRAIGKLGILEYFLVTPSHHRVHHASNEAYLDKNYGDILIIWDKLFGTFAEEREEAEQVYGLVHPLGSYSFLWQHFHFALELLYAVRLQTGWRNKLKLLIGRPEQVPAAARVALEERFMIHTQTQRPPDNRRIRRYVTAQLGCVLGLLFLFLLFEAYVPNLFDLAVTTFILLTLVNCGAILEQRRWVIYLEYLRATVLFLTAYAAFQEPAILVTFLGLSVFVFSYFTTLQRQYLGLIYGPSH